MSGRVAIPNHHSVGRFAFAQLPPTTPNQPSLRNGKNGGCGDQIEKDGSPEEIRIPSSGEIPLAMSPIFFLLTVSKIFARAQIVNHGEGGCLVFTCASMTGGGMEDVS